MRELLAYGIIFSMDPADRAGPTIIDRFWQLFLPSFILRNPIAPGGSSVHISTIVFRFKTELMDSLGRVDRWRAPASMCSIYSGPSSRFILRVFCFGVSRWKE